MPNNSFTVPAVGPRTGPSLVGTTGEPPEPEASVAVPALAAVAPAAPRVSVVNAAQQAGARRAPRRWIVFMILAPSVSPAGRMPRFAWMAAMPPSHPAPATGPGRPWPAHGTQ